MTRYRDTYTDRHAPAPVLTPDDRRELPARREHDELDDACPACTPVYEAGRWRHDRSCPLRLRA